MIRMTEGGKPLRLMIRFSIPLLLANALQMFYSLADSAIVGRMLGVNAFAAVGATGSTFWLVLSTVLGVTQGFGTVFAQRFGAKDTEGLRRTFVSSVYLTAALGLLIGLAGVFGSRGLLILLNTPPELLDGATTCLRVLIGGMPVFFASNLMGAALRALGDSKTPLLAMIFASVLNIVLDLALVKPFGIAGIASATLLAQGSACAYCLRALVKTGLLKGCGRKPDAGSAKELLRLGLPMGMRNAVIETGGLIVQRYTNGYGPEFVAGVAAAKRMYSLLVIAAGAFEAAVATFVAQNFGAGRNDRVKQGVSTGLRLMLVSSVIISGFTLLFGRFILSLMIEGDPEQVKAVLDVGVRQLNVLSLGMPVLYLLFLYRSALQGIGRPLIPMLSGFAELFARVASALFITPVWGEWGVLLSDTAGWFPAVAMLLMAYRFNMKKTRGD